jgi:hypothetical protein
MSVSQDNTEDRGAKYALKKFFIYATFALFGYVTLASIAASSNIFQAVIMSAIVWFVVIYAYRKRDFLGHWLSTDLTFKQLLHERKMASTASPAVLPKSAVPRTQVAKPTPRAWDYSAADNDFLQPLSASEKDAFSSIVEVYHKEA